MPGVTATLTASVRTSRPAGTSTTRAASVPLAWRPRSRSRMLSLTLGLSTSTGVIETTGAVGAEATIAEPSSLVAVTTARRAAPPSAAVTR